MPALCERRMVDDPLTADAAARDGAVAQQLANSLWADAAPVRILLDGCHITSISLAKPLCQGSAEHLIGLDKRDEAKDCETGELSCWGSLPHDVLRHHMMGLIASYRNRVQETAQFRKLLRLRSAPVREAAPRAVPGRARQLSEAERNQLARDYEGGATMRELSAKYRINRVRVSKQLARLASEVRKRRMAPSEVAEAIRLYESGVSMAMVGNRLGFDVGAIHYA